MVWAIGFWGLIYFFFGYFLACLRVGGRSIRARIFCFRDGFLAANSPLRWAKLRTVRIFAAGEGFDVGCDVLTICVGDIVSCFNIIYSFLQFGFELDLRGCRCNLCLEQSQAILDPPLAVA
jgi:hypothetical protein